MAFFDRIYSLLRSPAFLAQETEEISLWDELYNYFYDTYFNPDLGSYENFSFGSGTLMSIRTIVFGLAIGILIAGCCSIFDKRVLGDFVRHLIGEECLSADRAKTLYDLGYHKNPFIRGGLRSGVTLRRVVRCVEEEEFEGRVREMEREYEEANRGKKMLRFKPPKFKMEPESMHFYIPEDMKYMAEVKFDKRGTNWFGLLLTIFLTLAIVFVVFTFLPDLLQMLDNLISAMKPESGYLH